MARTPTKQHHVIDAVRSQIVRGELLPGSRLPTLDDLEATYQISRVTAARVVDTLRRDGFIQSVSKIGCFVATHLPHLCRYALVFPQREHRMVPHGWKALAAQAAGADRSDGIDIALYNIGNIENERRDLDELISDIQSFRVAGVIIDFRTHSEVFKVTKAAGIPRVIIRANNATRLDEPQPPADISTVIMDYSSFRSRAVEWMAARGRRKIAVIGAHKVQVTPFESVLKKHGLTYEPYWLLSAGFDEPDRARDLVRLLLRGPAKDRPDGLILTDDNFNDYVASALADSGVNVPDDLDLLTFANWPTSEPALPGSVRLGFDMHQTFKLCLDSIDYQRKGKPGRETQFVQALFEDEITSAIAR